ncbi:hypothetical protein K438DRAFT_1836412 [Mycena galopus ATCC 62051]|nr:hypothetical protein K438DRAFT_1836412 [Mycena galopus ATCC 62051]
MPTTTAPCQYRTGKTLSSGMYATVKEAIHIKTGRYYACKIISKDGMEGAENLVRNEIAVLKRVHSDSASILKLHDYFQTAHSVYLCLDLCTGGTLLGRISTNGAYPEAKAADLVHTLCIAVKHIHDAGVVHRDLKPENILFRTPDEAAPVLVAGFGLSRMIQDASYPRIETSALATTPRYTAPEFFANKTCDKPSDIWGLGLLAFFVIAGCTPFERDEAPREVQAVVAGDYKFEPKDKWNEASRDFIASCLELEPSRRPKAGEALAHTWISPRSVLRSSRRSSLLSLANLRVFNPKRKWRIAALTIKALNRMHLLSRPSLSTQKKESSNYFDVQLKGETDFPSPISSVVSFSDQGSSMWRVSTSTAATEEETPSEISMRDDGLALESSVLTTLETAEPQSLPAVQNSESQQTPPTHTFGVIPLPPSSTSSTQPSSSSASSVTDPNVRDAVDVDANASSQGTADADISTFVIYAPDQISKDRGPITPDDVQIIENCFGDGGLVVSLHRPLQAEAWVEDHYEDRVFQTGRSSGLGSPVATMLSPGVPALAIFGSILDDRVLDFAKTLAEVSGFAIMIRPVGDDPVSEFAQQDGVDDALPMTPGSESEEDHEDEDEDRVDFEEEASNATSIQVPSPGAFEGPALRLRGGKGDDSDEEDGPLPWMSKAHKAIVWLKLRPDEKHEYSLGVRTKTTFQLQSEYEDNTSDTRPEVIGNVSLTVETRAKILPDRSYSSLGFLAHRQSSVIDREFIDCGFEYPDQTLKTIDQVSKSVTVGVNPGYANLHPTVIPGVSYTKTGTKAVELADNKSTPRCLIFHDPGDRWNKDGKSYTSYDITTVPRKDPRTGMMHPLKARFAMGINVHRNEENPKLPKISFITRNQVILWISDPTMKSRVRGLLVLMTTFIPNIRTPELLFVQEELDVHFQAEGDPAEKNPPTPPAAGEKSMALWLAVAPIDTKKSRKNSITELFADVRRKAANKEPTLADLPLQEYISRGWDDTNKTWRGVLWTSLDKDFRATEIEKAPTTPVWKLDWNSRKQDNDPDGEAPDNDLVFADPVEVVSMQELGGTENNPRPEEQADIVRDVVPNL